MGEIDTMSTIHDNEKTLAQWHNRLPPHKYWQYQHIAVLKTLFRLVDPSTLHKYNSDHHAAYMTVSKAVTNLITHVLNQDYRLKSLTSRGF